jgi:hypothetical protein
VIFDSVYGANAAKRNETLARLDTQSRALQESNDAYAQAKAARELFLRSPGTGKDAIEAADKLLNSHRLIATTQYTAFEPTYTAYRALPEEADAWDAGSRAAAAVNAALSTPLLPTIK